MPRTTLAARNHNAERTILLWHTLAERPTFTVRTIEHVTSGYANVTDEATFDNVADANDYYVSRCLGIPLAD